jgi:hypothetical protein
LSAVSRHIYHVLLFTKYLNDLDSKNHSDWLVPIKVHQSFKKNRMEFYSIKVHQSPSKILTKVFDTGLHGQKTLSKKTLTKFLMENFDRVNEYRSSGSLNLP